MPKSEITWRCWACYFGRNAAGEFKRVKTDLSATYEYDPEARELIHDRIKLAMHEVQQQHDQEAHREPTR